MKIIPLLCLLLLGACASIRRTTHSGAIAVQSELLRSIDSLTAAVVVRMAERMNESEGETVTDLIVYDTDKPVDDSTGLPPVKAELRREQRHRQTGREVVGSHSHNESHVTAEMSDRQLSETSLHGEEKRKPGMGSGMLRLGIGVFLLAVVGFAIWIFYKRIKKQ